MIPQMPPPGCILNEVESEEGREKGLAHLMKTYEEEALGSSTEMGEFWDTFGGILMKGVLGFVVQSIP